MIVEHVTLELETAQTCAVMGESGSGKSSILAAVLGFVKPRSGKISIDGKAMRTLRPAQWRHVRRHVISAIFQQGELIGELSPVENVAVAPLIAGETHHESFRRAEVLLSQLGLPTGEQPTSTLSGGEQQRVAVARALATRPRIILADEPTAALDAENRSRVGELLLSIPERWGCSVLLATHDEALATSTDCTYLLIPHALGPSTWTEKK